ncbi:telomere length regulation protein-domain-containing protein [Flagelloscypha sp. PMI_526]|nr:telomere length regulation protein-domain-containing protein [Flagelloscypha sp. PMI_526]
MMDALNLINHLKEPLHDEDQLLTWSQYNTSPLVPSSLIPHRHIHVLQEAILTYVAPAWADNFANHGRTDILTQFFCPDAFSFSFAIAGQVARLAYSTILSQHPLTDFSIFVLQKLTNEYPFDRIHEIIFGSPSSHSSPKAQTQWEDYLRNVCMVPNRVANALSLKKNIPVVFAPREYFVRLVERFQVLVLRLSGNLVDPQICQPIATSITKFAHIGLFLPEPEDERKPSFFAAILPLVRQHDSPIYFQTWRTIFNEIPSTSTLTSVLTSAFFYLNKVDDTDPSDEVRWKVKQDALLLHALFGSLAPASSNTIWDVVIAIFQKRSWHSSTGRIVVSWAALSNSVEDLVFVLEDIWAFPEHIKRSFLIITLTFLVALSNCEDRKAVAQKLGLSPKFISAVGMYLKHMDASVRLCGMLAAEVVAHSCMRKLEFGGWEGEDEARVWARGVRLLLGKRDADAQEPEGLTDTLPAGREADEDPIQIGHSSNESFRSNSYSDDDTAIEQEPTLVAGKKKIARPVYLLQLGEMLRGPVGMEQETPEVEADKMDVALASAAELIRRKEGFGSEIEDNAENLCFIFIALQDKFELSQFEENRQAAVNALVVCCPELAAPTLIQEFFNNQYSVAQRYVILNGLVVGARELAGFELSPDAAIFPSKLLPPNVHKEISDAERNNAASPLLTQLTRQALSDTRDRPAGSVVRQRLLHLPSFLCVPLINRFWAFLRDEQTRERRTNHLSGRGQYRGAGSGLVLNPVVLERFLQTLAVLVHAAQNAPEWLSVISPESLQLAVAIGAKPVSMLSSRETEGDEEEEGKEAAVLTASLELALIVLEGSLEVDGGRVLSLENTELLIGTKEWAELVFRRLEDGARLPGVGGRYEERLRQAVAGLLLKISSVESRWRRSIVEIR